jgi:nitrogen fixation protein FixH
MNTTMHTPRRNGEITGKTVLICFVGFFGIVATVNAIMIRAAVTTFAGTETASAYKAGLGYKNEESAAAAQAKLDWQVDVRISHAASGEMILTVDVRDQSQLPVYGISVAARLAHPLNARLDRAVELARMTDGSFRGTAEATPGQWTLTIDVTRDGERVYRTKSRVVLK